jgi:hypothetical protein
MPFLAWTRKKSLSTLYETAHRAGRGKNDLQQKEHIKGDVSRMQRAA